MIEIKAILIFILPFYLFTFQAFSQPKSKKSDTYIFNFGANLTTDTNSDYLVTPETKYSSEYKFGLLSKSSNVFTVKKNWAYNYPFLSSGITSEEKIVFRADIEPGTYFVEIVMSGGNTRNWKGEIKINDSIIENELFSFTSNAESDQAPPYWAILREVNIDSDSAIFSIIAEDQPATICGLSFYKTDLGNLRLVKGRIIKTESFAFPNSNLAIKLINEGKVSASLKIINSVDDEKYRFQKAQLFLATAGRLEAENPIQLVDNAKYLLTEERSKNPSDEVLLNLKIAEIFSYAYQSYNRAGWNWSKINNESGIFDHINFSGMGYEEITKIKNHPLQIRASYELAKVCYWNWIEQSGENLIKKADLNLNFVKKYYPNNAILKMYLGERIQSANYPERKENIPNWAYLQKKALDGILDIIHYWVQNRQAENGEFGGKYDDDVEMMRWWSVARTVATDSVTLLGMKRLVDGIWVSDWIENGFSKKVRDVEHSSEPIADTQPMMIGLDYGNPIYVERCMESLDKINLWTGINTKGHRHFKSSWYSATEIDTIKPKDCDVEMNTRTVKAIRWLAWYNGHPLALEFLKEWSDSWLADCLRTDKGKPKGIVPASIRFGDDQISAYSDNWYEAGMFWRYYDYTGGTKMLNQFLSSYLLFSDSKYLEPIELTLKLVEENYSKDLSDADDGGEKWITKILLNSRSFIETAELWRLITGNSKYDNLFIKIGSDYIKYRLNNDLNNLENGSQNIIDHTYFNRELITTEAYFTDRIWIGDQRSRKHYGASHLESMYMGSSMANLFYPFQPISWKGIKSNISAVVLDSSPKKLKIKSFNHESKNINAIIVFHQMENGLYNFELSSLNDGKIKIKKTFEKMNRNFELEFKLDGLEESLITISQLEKLSIQNRPRPDLAIIDSELEIKEIDGNNVKIIIPVHNIGILPAENFYVDLVKLNRSGSEVLEKKKSLNIDAPIDLISKIKFIEFIIPNLKGNYQIKISSNPQIDEISLSNNQISFSLN